MNNLMNKLMNKGRHQKKKEEKVNLSFMCACIFVYVFCLFLDKKDKPWYRGYNYYITSFN